MDELIDVVQNAVNAHDKVSQIKNMMQQQQYSDKDSQAKLKTYLEAAEQELTMPTTICKRPTASTSHALMIIE